MSKWGTSVEIETKRRIQVSVAAYAYEFKHDSIIDDATFDKECLALQDGLVINTTRPDLDQWFRENFDPSTGVWIHDHPELNKIAELYKRISSRDSTKD